MQHWARYGYELLHVIFLHSTCCCCVVKLSLMLKVEAAIAAAAPEDCPKLQATLDGLKAATVRLEAIDHLVKAEQQDDQKTELRRASL